MAQRERITLRRFEAKIDSVEGKLFRYLNEEPCLMTREAVLRALKAFYLPWALGSQANEVDAARTAIEELQYRIFQIQQRFLPEELALAVVPTSSKVGATPSSSEQAGEKAPLPITLSQMRQDIDEAALEQFLDDF